MKVEGTERRRDAGATRLALIDAAAALFAERGYERTTVRDIAARAGFNQALLFRYFGSKKALFGEVMARDGRKQVRDTPPEHLLEAALRGLLAPGGSGHHDRSLEVFLRSSSDGDAAAETGRLLSQEYASVLATLTGADDAGLRSDLILAWLLGIGLTRNVIGREPLASADPDDVCRLMLEAARTILEKLPGSS
ncbi:TetR family transcriptional regulator [Streptomyces sp. NBC_01267]|uniref:TetR/AcrR family transcriptional regulator n=1 Tax=unclassified Streptomyces TaxID=2593676 RepID=UPI0020245313|nr:MULTISPECIES: TetR/AcrR family transcriptional regulator [unclassified Streptomyces]MCX4553455.1 TetR family transcriptional regulator [Streptomyces sp. NBC_01500]WSV52454.1 TetR family transcriptional regulator [Streptomyces sp. NBC_01014]